MEESVQKLTEVTVDGASVSKEQLEEMRKNPKIRLKEIAPNQFKTLTLMNG